MRSQARRTLPAAYEHEERDGQTEVESGPQNDRPATTFTRPATTTRHRTRQGTEKAAELWDEQGWLFTNEVGNPLNHRTDLAHRKQLLKAAGVRDARLHDARHAAATVLLELGVPDRTAMQIMG